MFGSKWQFECPFQDGFCYVFEDPKGSVGISKDKKGIAFGSKDQPTKAYGRDQIRSHSCVIVEGSRVVGGGLKGASHNLGESLRAAEKSGLYVRVKDIDNPLWRVNLQDVNDQSKWDEILLQWYDGEL